LFAQLPPAAILGRRSLGLSLRLPWPAANAVVSANIANAVARRNFGIIAALLWKWTTR
jgi:hypothetical protein